MKVQLPWAGKATGSSAGLIYQSYWGKTYARTFPAIFHYPNTPAQQACQAQYWHFRKLTGACYDYIKGELSSYQKRIKNPYNELFQSIRDMILQHELNPFAPWITSFGVDSLMAIKYAVLDVYCKVYQDVIICDAKSLGYTSKFDFTPTKCWICVWNWTRQEFVIENMPYSKDDIFKTWPNTTMWNLSDQIYWYFAISNTHYFSNFFLAER